LVDQVRDLDSAQRPQRRTISVVFGDIRGFSTAAEKWDPEFLIEALNHHLTAAATAINEYDGLIDKYDGDTVMALYNTPLNPQEDHVIRAVKTALDVRDQVTKYHESIPEDECLYFGIGIHCGEAVVGNVGSPSRKDYSAIGDAINLSERLQEMALPSQILMSEAAYKQVEEFVVVNELEAVRVKGRQAKEQIYELVSLANS
jgi:class 3 adenylate cyclase